MVLAMVVAMPYRCSWLLPPMVTRDSDGRQLGNFEILEAGDIVGDFGGDTVHTVAAGRVVRGPKFRTSPIGQIGSRTTSMLA